MNYSGLWEKREGRIICRAFAAWDKLSETEVAGVVAGYAGGGTFIQENFYCQFTGSKPVKLIVDFTDHISGEESPFDDLDNNASELSDQALDVLLEFHDQDSWEEAEQLLLLAHNVEDMEEVEADLLKGGTQYPDYLENLFEYAGLTARP
jgi:hypothetical protein